MKKIILICLGFMLFACDTKTKKADLNKISKEEWIDYNSLVTKEDCESADGTWTAPLEAVQGYGTEGEESYVVPIEAVEASCSAPSLDSLK